MPHDTLMVSPMSPNTCYLCLQSIHKAAKQCEVNGPRHGSFNSSLQLTLINSLAARDALMGRHGRTSLTGDHLGDGRGLNRSNNVAHRFTAFFIQHDRQLIDQVRRQ
jgi:hypothetical protein